MDMIDTYEKLENYIRKVMKPNKSLNYQPVMILTLNQNNGRATKKEIQQELHKSNPDLPPEHFNEFPFDVLENNGVVIYDKDKDLYVLPAFETYKDRTGKKGNISFYCSEKIFDRKKIDEIESLTDKGVSQSVINALIKFWREGQTLKVRTRDALSNPRRKHAIPIEEQQTEEITEEQIMHGMVKGVYIAAGEDYAQALQMRPKSKFKLEIDRTYETLKINYDFLDFEKYTKKGNEQITWLEKSYNEDIPIGVVFGYDVNKWLILGLCKVTARPTDTHFVLESYGVSEDKSIQIKENAIQKYDHYHTVEGITNVRDADWTKILSDVDPAEFEGMIEQNKIVLSKRDIKISEIINDIDSGVIAVPKFQRYYEWKPDQVTSLLNSIFHEYFIGNLLVWNAENTEEKEMCGLLRIEGSNPEHLKGNDIIIDGQQRVTSIYYAVKGPEKDKKKEENHPGFFYINLNNFITNGDEEEVIVGLKEKIPEEETYNKLYFPFYNLETSKCNKWLRELKAFVNPKTPEDIKKLDNHVDTFRTKLNRFWDGYTVPQLQLSNVDFDKIATIFQKVNTTGTALGVFSIMIVKMWVNGIDLRKLWDATLDQYPNIQRYQKAMTNKKSDMGKYMMETISVSYSKSKSCKRKDLFNMVSVEGWNKTEFDKIWGDTSKWINAAIKKLESINDDGFGVESAKSIPYEPIIPILASLLRELDINFRSTQVDCYEKIQKWYWVSIFGKRFSDSVDAKKTSDFKDMVAWFEDDEKIPRFITTFESQFNAIILDDETKGAIYDGMFSILTKKGAQDFEIRVTLDEKKPDMDHIFPQSQMKQFREKHSILNMTWLTPETNREKKRYRMPSEYIKQVMEDNYDNDKRKFLDVLSKHLINEEGLDALLEDDFEGFINSREKEMKKEIVIRTGIEYRDNEVNVPTQINKDTPFSNMAALMWKYEECNKEFMLVSLFCASGDLKRIMLSGPQLKVKKIRLLTSVEVFNKTLKEDFMKFNEEMEEKGNIKSEMRVMSEEVKGEQHARYLADPKNCWKSLDYTIAKSGKSDSIDICKTVSLEDLEKWWDDSYDVVKDVTKIQPLLEEHRKKVERRKQNGNQ